MKKIAQLGLILSLVLSSIFAEEKSNNEAQVENVEKVAVDNTPLLKNDHFLTFEFDATIGTGIGTTILSGSSFAFMFKLDEKYSVGIRQESAGISMTASTGTGYGSAEVKAVVFNYLLSDEFKMGDKKLGRLYVGTNIGTALISSAITDGTSTIPTGTIAVYDGYLKLQRDLSTHGGMFLTSGLRLMPIGDSSGSNNFPLVMTLFARAGFNIGF